MVLDSHEENLLLVTTILFECFLLFFCAGLPWPFLTSSGILFVLITLVSSTEIHLCTYMDKLVTSSASLRFGELLFHVKIDIYLHHSVKKCDGCL